MRIAFVIQRYGREVIGGAETFCRRLAERLSEHCSLEVLTTCARDHVTWEDEYAPGSTRVDGVHVRRFRVDYPKHGRLLHRLSTAAFEPDAPLPLQERWMQEMGPYSSGLFRHLRGHRDRYDAVFFFTYLFASTCFGVRLVGDRALLIPMAHDEPPFHLGLTRDLMSRCRAVLFNTPEERELGMPFLGNGTRSDVLGIGVDEPEAGDTSQFRLRHGIRSRFLLYAGRIEEAKGCGELLQSFLDYRRRRRRSDVRLVFVGREVMELPEHPDVIRLGFLPDSELNAALTEADVVVAPSRLESLSLVSLEAWARGTAVLANANCAVLAGQCSRSGGGLTYSGPQEFETQLDRLLVDEGLREELGARGRRFVHHAYRWDEIVERYLEWAAWVAGAASACPGPRPGHAASAPTLHRASPDSSASA